MNAYIALLERALGDESSFFELAVAGELLQRSFSLWPDRYDNPERVETLLTTYRLEVRRRDPRVDLDRCVTDALGRLRDYAFTPLAERTYEVGTDALRELDALMCVALVQVRLGVLSEAKARDFGGRINRVVYRLTHRLFDLCDYADEWELSHNTDLDLPEVFGFWWQLSHLSADSHLLRKALSHRSKADREAVIERITSRGLIKEAL